jgi:hypothetical protein
MIRGEKGRGSYRPIAGGGRKRVIWWEPPIIGGSARATHTEREREGAVWHDSHNHTIRHALTLPLPKLEI